LFFNISLNIPVFSLHWGHISPRVLPNYWQWIWCLWGNN
jgi:hypothetical protein